MAQAVLEQIRDQTQTLTQALEQKHTYFLCKRCIDLVISLPILVVLSPLLLLIALLIKVDSSGPVLFKQERMKLRKPSADGKASCELDTFIMYKLRTMRPRSDPAIHQQFMKALIRNDENEVALLNNHASAINKLSNDARITRVGKVLRKLNLDELPQLWNVVKGDMSLIGPRPPLSYEVAEYKPHHWKRLMTIPGCVGLWQVRGWNTLTFDEMVDVDVWYVENQSLWLDAKIVLMTVPAILSGKGGG
jgi:lipopolysaccharide/colanic/teichoic acid biosynthesis glycosyltransferase